MTDERLDTGIDAGRDARGGAGRDVDEPVELTAWREMCRRLEAVGEQLLSPPYPADPEDRAEGFAHLADQVLCWLGWSVGHADAASPFFMRQNDLVTQWGGPNADNVYRHARIDPVRRYRIRGRMHSADDFILALRAGFMHQQRWGTLAEHTASDLGINSGDDFELLLGGEGVVGGAAVGEPEGGVKRISLAIPDGAVMASIREYYIDWCEAEPATFTIECLDDVDPTQRVTPGQLLERFDEAASGVEHSMRYWNQYMIDERSARTDNAFAGSLKVEKGLAAARYAFCFWDLAEDETLVVETDVPDARYWSFQLYVPGWFELVDPVSRITSRNHLQTELSADGRVRMVVGPTDPGIANWLDTGGRRQGLCTLRWFWPTGDDEPTPMARVIRTSELEAALDPAATRVTPEDRAAELEHRRAHLAWRFRV
jgi:hypothetical protein